VSAASQGGHDERELTVRAIWSGLLFGGVIAAANVYAGTMVGIVDAGSATIVLVAYALFAALGRPLSRLEANVAQVAGSSASTMAVTAGVVGPVPALAMSGHAPEPVWVALWGAALGAFGALLAIPFRRQLIEEEQLPFPSGQATGELINSLAGATSSARGRVVMLFGAMAVAALVLCLRDLWGILPGMLTLPIVVGGIPAASLGIGVAVSPFTIGVGLLVGPRMGVSVLAGGVVAWAVLAPLLHQKGIVNAADYGSVLQWVVWPGAALLVASSFTSFAFSGPAMWRGWRGRKAAAHGGDSWPGIRVGAALGGVAVVVVGWIGFDIHPLIGVLALLMAAAFAIIGLRATGATDQAPAGPLGALAQGVTGVVAPGSTLPTLFAGGVTNGVTGHSSGLMTSWKTTYVVGGSPRRALAAQLLGIGVGTVSAVTAYVLLDNAYGIGSAALPSPPAQSWKATAEVVQSGIGGMAAGAPLAALIAVLAGVLLACLERTRFARLVPSAVGLGVGFLVPLPISAGIAVGAIALAVARRSAPDWTERQGPSLAAGLITGEGLMALVLAALLVSGVLSPG
jgi:uncharacterized oligopeptide transporter (OPT) family protein